MSRTVQIEPVYRVVGARLFELRRAAGLTQEQVGARLDPPMTRAAIAMIETGQQRVQLHTLQQLTAIFRVSLDDVVSIPKLRIADVEGGEGGAR